MNKEIREVYNEDTMGRKYHTPIITHTNGFKEYGGEITTFKYDKPYSWLEFRRLPDEHKKIWLEYIRVRFNISQTTLAEYMLVSNSAVGFYARKFGLRWERIGKAHELREEFEQWFKGTEPTEAVEDNADDIVIEAPNLSKISDLCISFDKTPSLNELASVLGNTLDNPDYNMTITINRN